MKYVLGIDIGTTHCKAVAMETNGNILHEGKTSYSIMQSTPGQSEQDAEAIFSTVLELLQHSLLSLKQHQLLAICFSSAMHGVMAVDISGHPLTNIFTWADTRSREAARQLKELPGSKDIYNATGTPVHAMSPLCKIAWLRRSMPGIFDVAKKFIGIKEYVFYKLFGTYVVDHSIASATGLFNIRELQWHDEALQAAGINESHLSQPVPVTQTITGLKSEYRLLLGLEADVPFIIGASDGCLANLGSGAVQPGHAALTIGTSGAVRVVINEPQPDVHGRLFNYILSEGLFVSGGSVSNGAAALKWFAENFLQHTLASGDDINALLQLAQDVPPGSGGLIFLPYLSGERAPVWDASARGVFLGLQTAHRKEHMVRAVVEGISFALRQVMEAVEEVNGKVNTVHASGGFTASTQWVQMVADILGKKIISADTADASAVGAALLALHVDGCLQQLQQAAALIPQGKIFMPDMRKHEVYTQYYQVYKGLYAKVKDDFEQLEKLARLQTET